MGHKMNLKTKFAPMARHHKTANRFHGMLSPFAGNVAFMQRFDFPPPG